MKITILFAILFSVTFSVRGESDGFYSITQKIESILNEAASCSGECKEELSFNVEGFNPVQMQTYFRVAGYDSELVKGSLVFNLSEKIKANSQYRDMVIGSAFIGLFLLFLILSAQRMRFGRTGLGVSVKTSSKSIM